uniref:Small-subunit processome Utp12 domain-containing protein n=1 Tax=Timema cristinae TaxID=61476 RepID=A0A7R9CYL0_TIMCR|nr:unnamed protein product [Timema cristinae]
MSSTECSAFSEDGKYFGYCGDDGKLKIWETDTGTLKKEYIPNLHLSEPCTCLTWLLNIKHSDNSIPKYKKKSVGKKPLVALGTAAGNISVYSMAAGTVLSGLIGVHTTRLNTLSWSKGTNLFSAGDDGIIVEWDVCCKKVVSKWKANESSITCLLVLPGGENLLSAHHRITLWCIASKFIIKTFYGHATEVTRLSLVITGTSYCVSAARDDRYISVWPLVIKNQEKHCVAQLISNDPCVDLSVMGDELTNIGVVTRTGALQIFRHHLNGKRTRPLKPDLTLQMATSGGKDSSSEPLPIVGTHLCEPTTAIVAYGQSGLFRFERITLETVARHTSQTLETVARHYCQTLETVARHYCQTLETVVRHTSQTLETVVRHTSQTLETVARHYCQTLETSTSSSTEMVCLVRDAPTKGSHKREKVAMTKVVVPLVDDSAEYVSAAAVGSNKRVREPGLTEVAMEERLDNLSLNQFSYDSTRGPPKPDNLVQLLLQGLKSKDTLILHSVLLRKDEQLIFNTVSRLPLRTVAPLLTELCTLLQSKSQRNHMVVPWLKAMLAVHAGQLLSNPELSQMLAPLLSLIEARLGQLTPLMRLRGRLELLVGQIGAIADTNELQDSLLVYREQGSSDEDDLMETLGGSDNEDSSSRWSEEDEEQKNMST